MDGMQTGRTESSTSKQLSDRVAIEAKNANRQLNEGRTHVVGAGVVSETSRGRPLRGGEGARGRE